MNPSHPVPRRRAFLRRAGALAATLPLWSPARAAVPQPRALAFAHTHTGERLQTVFALGESYRPEALGQLNRFLRDHYTGQVGVMDPPLFDLLYRVQALLGCEGPYEVISGYRCPDTNERLRLKGGGGVARRSLHMDGKAIDVRLPGVPLAELRDAALELGRGGVGYYAREQFVHLDTGRVRSW
ncbi:YcbK family protein [Azohydromonas caseinilytica]|uniref:Murein endopeptidase K n=1 Tax=Azohydromonas caseinilytica TaxID=2728836 RepID=A0A848FE33_9BURK|nr:YcbK family protein [Azohydromonas caseinilytica]NML17658.1 DUF882 domain-containing protein [Azohydromonas caseinilytica]